MLKDQRDILEVLRFELDFLDRGGYGRSVRTPWKWTSTFQHSPSCINFNDPGRRHPCHDCPLIDFVPSDARTQDVPCHHIPIGPQGETVSAMERQHDLLDLEAAIRSWLQTTIRRIEQQRASEAMPEARSA